MIVRSFRGAAASVRALIVAALFVVPATSRPDPGTSQHFDFLYIDANVGMSSGGHVALRIGDEVFHFQHDPGGFITLARERWQRFRQTYNDLDNRNIHVARIAVAPADLERIRDRFIQHYLNQNRHLDFLASLQRDMDWLRHIAAGTAAIIPAAGLFAAGTAASEELAKLAADIESASGHGFLGRESERLRRLLETMAYRRPQWDPGEIADSHYPRYPETSSDIYLNAASRLTAFRVLSGGWELAEGALLDPRPHGIPATALRLTSVEHERLQALGRYLKESILALVTSRRSDSGFAILLATARYLAVERSLQQQRLLLLHPGFRVVQKRPFPVEAEQRRALATAARRFAISFRETRNAFFRLEDPDEVSLNLLENAAARYFEVLCAVRLRQPFRLLLDFEIPRAPGPWHANGRLMHEAVGSQAIENAEAAHHRFLAQWRATHPYNLLTHNCATELVRTLNSAFATEPEAAAALGAALDPAEPSVLIPFRLFDQVTTRLRITQTHVLPSYRNRMLASFARRQSPLWIHLGESNTATSSIYRRRSGDTLFLMFTEDVPWLRPVLGAANLGYGMANVGVGILSAPFDRGERIAEGIRGALFSLPELAFFNIRKGSFAASDGL